MMTRNTSIFTYKIIQSAAYSFDFAESDFYYFFQMIIYTFDLKIDPCCPFIKLQKVFFFIEVLHADICFMCQI